MRYAPPHYYQRRVFYWFDRHPRNKCPFDSKCRFGDAPVRGKIRNKLQHCCSTMIKQRTLKQPIKASGVGLHCGDRVTLICARRRSIPASCSAALTCQGAGVQSGADLVNDTRLSSTLVKDNVRVATIEHLMSALAGSASTMHIDIDAQETPIMDGSAATFIFLLQRAGIVEQNAAKKFVRVKNRRGERGRQSG